MPEKPLIVPGARLVEAAHRPLWRDRRAQFTSGDRNADDRPCAYNNIFMVATPHKTYLLQHRGELSRLVTKCGRLYLIVKCFVIIAVVPPLSIWLLPH